MKHVKLGLYGLPGAGKSVFANEAPNRFFITTDGNYEYLEDFGAKDEDHVQAHSWKELKAIIAEIVTGKKYADYDTYVLDLVENAFKWCEYEYCKANGYEHISEPGYAKGYDVTRTEFLIELSRLLDMPKNIILIFHGNDYNMADKRGITKLYHGVSNRIPDKVVTEIEGKVRMFLRCYAEDVESDGKWVTKRYLSLVPKANEFGIIRGFDAASIPTDISLDFDTFAKVIGLELPGKKEAAKPVAKATTKITDIKLEKQVEPAKPEPVKPEPAKPEVQPEQKVEAKQEPTQDVAKAEEPKQEVVDTPAQKVVVEKTASQNEMIDKKQQMLKSIMARLEANKKK